MIFFFPARILCLVNLLAALLVPTHIRPDDNLLSGVESIPTSASKNGNALFRTLEV